jgi:hypothetical protein
MPNENNSEEERFARQDQQAYSGWSSLITGWSSLITGWSSLITLAIIAFVIGIFFLMFLRH